MRVGVPLRKYRLHKIQRKPYRCNIRRFYSDKKDDKKEYSFFKKSKEDQKDRSNRPFQKDFSHTNEKGKFDIERTDKIFQKIISNNEKNQESRKMNGNFKDIKFLDRNLKDEKKVQEERESRKRDYQHRGAFGKEKEVSGKEKEVSGGKDKVEVKREKKKREIEDDFTLVQKEKKIVEEDAYDPNKVKRENFEGYFGTSRYERYAMLGKSYGGEDITNAPNIVYNKDGEDEDFEQANRQNQIDLTQYNFHGDSAKQELFLKEVSRLSTNKNLEFKEQKIRKCGKGMCIFCSRDRDQYPLEPMNVPLLLRFMNSAGFIKHRNQTGLCLKMQSRVARTIKTARGMQLFGYKNGFHVKNPCIDKGIPLYPKEEEYYSTLEKELEDTAEKERMKDLY